MGKSVVPWNFNPHHDDDLHEAIRCELKVPSKAGLEGLQAGLEGAVSCDGITSSFKNSTWENIYKGRINNSFY